MNLDLTQTPWPEWIEARGATRELDTNGIRISEQEYELARKRVNLHDRLLHEVGTIVKGYKHFPKGIVPLDIEAKLEQLEALYEEAKE